MALRQFVAWAEDGWYDFCSLPYAVKSPMNLVDEDAVKQIPDHFEGKRTVVYNHKEPPYEPNINQKPKLITKYEGGHTPILGWLTAITKGRLLSLNFIHNSAISFTF